MPRSVSASRPNTRSVRGRGRPATRFLTSAISASMRSASAALSFVLPMRAPSWRIVVGDVRQTGVLVQKHRNPGALELRAEIVLRSVHDHEVRFQRDDALDIGIDEAADLRPRQRFRRIAVEIADADHTRSCAHGKQHLGGGRDDRDDALRGRLRDSDGPAKAGHHVQKQRENDYRFLMSSHRKNGPPMMAVTTPTGISSGASAVREIVSHATRNAAPPNADAGSTRR